MARILITMLGTGQKRDGGYRTADYEIEGKKYCGETFIAHALAVHYKADKIFILGTSGSIWDSVYRAFGGKDDDTELHLYDKKENDNITDDDLKNVSAVLDDFTGIKGSACFLVKYGLNDTELWNNFEQYLKISDYINQGDELYVDITHSFRSLAMMSFQMVQFIEQVRRKDITLKGIYYGMLEYSGKNNNIAPVVNISILAEIQEWTKAIGYLKYSGNASMLYELIMRSDTGVGSKVSNVFRHMAGAISIGNVKCIQNAVKIIKNRLKNLKNSGNPIVAYISGDIEDFVNRLDYDNEPDFCIALARWFGDCHNYGMSYIVLADGIISKVCHVNDLNPDTEDGQKKAKNIMNSFRHNEGLKQFRKTYDTVRIIRNSIAHSVDEDHELQSVENLNKSLNKYIDRIERGFKELDRQKDSGLL